MYKKIIKNKWGKINQEANKKLKERYSNMNINHCEINLEGCCKNWTLAFAHRHRRIWYMKQPELLSSYNQTLIACQSCHFKIDGSKELLEKTFLRLRGKEII